MKTKIVLFIVAFIVWLGLTWSVELLSLIVGVGVAILVAFLTSDMFTPLRNKTGFVSKVPEFKQPVRYLWFLYYIPVFLWECLKANFDVAYRVGHPDLPINPGIVKVKTQLKTELALTFLANSITLTPGTLSVDVDKEKGYLYVHWINVKDKGVEGATRIVVEKFEKILRRIFE